MGRITQSLILFCSFWGQAGCMATTPIIIGPPPIAPTFTVNVSRLGDHLTLRYPLGEGVGKWREVCITTLGRVDDKSNPGEYLPWWTHSCWKPRFLVEEYYPDEGAFEARVVLYTVDDKGKETIWRHPFITIRVIEDAPDGAADEPIEDLQ
mgnify:CR=1 FL=1